MSFSERCAELAGDSRDDAERLHDLFRLAWERDMAEYPEAATLNGFPGHDHRWTDISAEAIERRKREEGAPLAVLESIDRSRLTPTDQLSYDLFERNVRVSVEGSRFPEEFLPVSQMGGVQQDAAMVLEVMTILRRQQYDDVLARLRGIPDSVEQVIALMERGLAAGVTPPQITMRDVPEQVRNQMVDDPDASPLLAPLAAPAPEVTDAEHDDLRRQAAGVVARDVIPAFQRLHDFLVERYIPACRESVGMGDLPDGDAWYAHRVRAYTTTDLSPAEIHEIGQGEVKRIRRQMEEVIETSGYTGSFAEFFDFLRGDDQFFFETGDDLLVAYRDIAKRVDPELVKLFGRLPRLPYGVIPVPSYAEKSQTTAYYMPGALEAARPGYFYANTYDLGSRPKWEMEALTLHEAVPGHHLQISLAQELEGLPEFRRRDWRAYTAYVEGWGLYAESLGEELGCYRDPYSKFGQLTYEMWRAVRLVVDTGIHALGWSRQQAIDFFLENAGKAEHDIVVEVDRYIVWPGQALAYKLGELKLKELRAFAAHELGASFDVRAFHDQVLGQGALPLETLDTRIRSWVRAQLT